MKDHRKLVSQSTSSLIHSNKLYSKAVFYSWLVVPVFITSIRGDAVWMYALLMCCWHTQKWFSEVSEISFLESALMLRVCCMNAVLIVLSPFPQSCKWNEHIGIGWDGEKPTVALIKWLHKKHRLNKSFTLCKSMKMWSIKSHLCPVSLTCNVMQC